MHSAVKIYTLVPLLPSSRIWYCSQVSDNQLFEVITHVYDDSEGYLYTSCSIVWPVDIEVYHSTLQLVFRSTLRQL